MKKQYDILSCFQSISLSFLVFSYQNLFENFRYFLWDDLKAKIDELTEGPLAWFYAFVGFTGVGIFGLIVSHLYLLYGAYKNEHKFLKKWLIANGILFTVLLILIVSLLFTGFFKLNLNQLEFIYALIITAIICGIRLLSGFIIFQYRINLLKLEKLRSSPNGITNL